MEPFQSRESRPLSVSTRLPLRADRLARSAEHQPLKHILHTLSAARICSGVNGDSTLDPIKRRSEQK